LRLGEEPGWIPYKAAPEPFSRGMTPLLEAILPPMVAHDEMGSLSKDTTCREIDLEEIAPMGTAAA
jgi:hypothetical protein